ncbi:uncharacterized protein LOC141532399 [Cotesia typhae]|uniref:uncharacterized protein LOC141532399 n=1 Tax=Cotesia typhae TaxID=2053667 RepID=UPI003D6820C3
MAAKAKKALNSTWGLIERTGRNSLKDRMYFYNSLVRSGALYGVEIWGWEGSKAIEAVYSRYCKAAMGLARNTPEYIWRCEGGLKSLKYICRERADRYLLDVMKMEEGRWPKIVLREEYRGILNGRPSKSGSKLNKALEEMCCKDITKMIWDNVEMSQIEQKLEEGLLHLQATMREEENKKIMDSSYNPWFKFLKTCRETEPYWIDRKTPSWMKLAWCRIRCDNIGKARKKGYRDWLCRLCQGEEETLEHIFRCRTLLNSVKAEARSFVLNWMGRKTGADFDWLLLQTLRGEPVQEICQFVGKLLKLTRGGDDSVLDVYDAAAQQVPSEGV